MRRVTLVSLTLVALLAGGPAFALGTEKFMGVSGGVKLGGGGNLVPELENVPAGADLFADGAGGYGWGGGVFGEFRAVWGFAGLELGLMFEKNRNWSTLEINNTVDTEWLYEWTAVRIPILIKGIVPMEAMRVYFGIGPEFVISTAPGTEFTITDGEQYVGDDDAAQIRNGFSARTTTDTTLCLDLGFAIPVWQLAISFDIRYAYNLSAPTDYDGRLGGNPIAFTPVEIVASSNHDLRLLLGVAYEYSFYDLE